MKGRIMGKGNRVDIKPFKGISLDILVTHGKLGLPIIPTLLKDNVIIAVKGCKISGICKDLPRGSFFDAKTDVCIKIFAFISCILK